MKLSRLFRSLAPLMAGGLLAGCALLRPLPDKTSFSERLAALPTIDLPLKHAVSIRWDDHQIPYIEAADDDDAAFALGIVHAHLRLGQMAIYRRIAQGRISEMGGPLAVDIDHGVRILGFGRAAAAIEKDLPPATRRWLERFVAGINTYQQRLKEPPYEYRVLNIEPEPWTVQDVLTFGRLAGTDVTWLVWFGLLQLRERPDWKTLWARLIDNGGDAAPRLAPRDGTAALQEVLNAAARSGSNSVAVAGSRSASGSALIANDPHLGINLPNTWLIVGLKSPSYHVVGLMVPGLPVFGIGRNPSIAWGGTNMRASVSDLIDISQLPPSEIRARQERIRVRWWPDKEVTLRDTSFGPVLTDAPQLAEFTLPPLALRWIGHEVSDEISAFLAVARARDFAEFKAALRPFSVPGQNMLFADAAGNIGKVMAVRAPDRSGPPPADLIVLPAESQRAWQRLRTVEDLPVTVNPSEGFLASANNRPTNGAVVGYFFSPDDRVERMAELLGGAALISVGDLEALQQDVYIASSVALRDVLVARLRALDLLATATAEESAAFELMAGWDGHYRPESRGPVAFELFRFAFTADFYRSLLGESDWQAFANVGRIKALLVEDIERAEAAALTGPLRSALTATAGRIGDFANWGEMHRLGLRHPLHFLPVVGERFRFADHPVGGSTDALMKTAHAATDQRHYTRYGANARHISDMADADANFFALLGGQDGWLNSEAFLDQVPLWLKGEYVQMPLRTDAVRERFPTQTVLKPTP